MAGRVLVFICGTAAAAVLAGCATTTHAHGGMTKMTEVRFVNLQRELTPDAVSTLTAAVPSLQEDTATRVVITGHAYDTASAAHNMARSKARAESVSEFLQSQGIDAARIVVDSRGDTDPPLAVQDFAARKHGNRVEVYLKRAP